MTHNKICTKCVMDTTDPEITFNEHGVCNHCEAYDDKVKQHLKLDLEGQEELKELVNTIKEKGANKEYDSVIGVSGGVDSTYVAYLVKQLGLRPLAVHLDNGWNSNTAVSNIRKTLEKLNIDLYTHVIDWDEFKDLQKAFLKASTPDGEIPSDHAIVSLLFKVAAKHNIEYIITGSNVTTEGVLPRQWSYGHHDWRYINKIHQEYGTKKRLKTYPHYTQLDLFYLKKIKNQKIIDILDYFNYDKEEAMQFLKNELGWEYYGGKHYESLYTKFYQAYILPEKFGYDKRKAHLSALVCAGQMSREKALLELDKPLYDKDEFEREREYVLKKLGLSEQEFEKLMRLKPKSYWDYPSYDNYALTTILKKAYKRVFK